MTAPRHLWSGNWELESSAHADDLAARRGRAEELPEPEPAPPTPSGSRRGRAIRAVRQRLRALRDRLRALPGPSRRRVRVGLLATFVTLLIATAAYAVLSDSSPTRKPQPLALNTGKPWLGVELANAPIRGALVSSVRPGSPAAAAGIRPGDVITQLDTEPIVAPAVFISAISGLQPGDRVDIQLQRGASQYTVHVALASHPAGNP